MKRIVSLVMMLFMSFVHAQSWEANAGILKLIGCYGKQDGIYCEYSYTLKEMQTSRVYWFPQEFKVYKQDGTSQIANAVAFGDNNFGDQNQGSSTLELIANVPVKVQAYFNIPSSLSSFRALAYKDVKFDNIPIRPYGSAPSTPTQLPPGSNVKGFSISLSNCQLQGQNYVCTATLTPTK